MGSRKTDRSREAARRSRRAYPSNSCSEYRGMWLLALFDLPVKEKDQKRAYVKFRRHLLVEGFTMLQYSVYAQYCVSEEASTAKRRRIRIQLPGEGQVRLVSVTDKQFAAMEVYLGKSTAEPEEPLGQGLLF